jgi:hypothetical protein
VSASFARNRWPLDTSRPTMYPFDGLPSRLKSTVYVCPIFVSPLCFAA